MLYYNTSWQGGSLRAPVASPRPWLFQGFEPISEPVDRTAGQTLAGDFALPAPIDLVGVPAPKTPDHFMETTSSRPRKGAFVLPIPWNHPIDHGAFEPLGTLTNPARIGCRQRVGAEPDQRGFLHLTSNRA